jgi:hypothetical protein
LFSSPLAPLLRTLRKESKVEGISDSDVLKEKNYNVQTQFHQEKKEKKPNKKRNNGLRSKIDTLKNGNEESLKLILGVLDSSLLVAKKFISLIIPQDIIKVFHPHTPAVDMLDLFVMYLRKGKEEIDNTLVHSELTKATETKKGAEKCIFLSRYKSIFTNTCDYCNEQLGNKIVCIFPNGCTVHMSCAAGAVDSSEKKNKKKVVDILGNFGNNINSFPIKKNMVQTNTGHSNDVSSGKVTYDTVSGIDFSLLNTVGKAALRGCILKEQHENSLTRKFSIEDSWDDDGQPLIVYMDEYNKKMIVKEEI